MASPLDELIKKAKEKKGIKVEEAPVENAPAAPQPKAKVPSAEEVLAKPKPVATPKTEEIPEFAVKKEGIMKIFERKKSPKVPKEPAPAEKISAETGGKEAPDKSTIEKEMEKVKKVKVASYGDTTIYNIPGQPLMYYFTPVPRPTKGEKTIINTIKEAATRIISIIPYKIRDPEQKRNVYHQKIMEILQSSSELRIPHRRFDFYADAVVREMVGYGLIDSLIKDDKLEEIMIIGAKRPVYVFHREYEMMKTNIEFFSEQEIEDLINRIARQVGRRVDISAPLLDARLPDGSRVNATIPPASVSGSTLTIRKFREDPLSIVDLLNLNTVNLETAAFLWLCVEGLGVKPANILIAGGTGSGKTTTLNVLASFIPAAERIVSIEDTAELNLPLKHWIRMESRPPGMEGTGEITMDILTKNSLRMRPDRIIVGEIRHDEAFSLFTAMNTGHEGCMGTVHANSPREAIVRVTSPPMNVPEVMLSGLDFVLIEHRLHDKKKGTIRRITEIAEVGGVLEGKSTTQTVFERDAVTDQLMRSNFSSNYLRTLEKYTGLSKKQIDAELKDRERFLKGLVDKNIRSIAEVSKACQDYLIKKSG